ncbi:hypothetical protein [Pseudonocardia sp. H11422]|uniref:hypothetical protein n=1 Tax=Pseudonocardia sp. H11422 TaxID=2835866 RepID=UPI001BDC8CB4|nr:hypothetical protein [Pseudonocardia sp. H11422]
MSDAMSFAELEGQYVELLPARTTMTTGCGCGGDGGGGGDGGYGINFLNINIAVFGDATQYNIAGNGGDGGNGGDALAAMLDS